MVHYHCACGTPAPGSPHALGQVPNLYAADEMEKIVSLVRPLAKAAGKLETRDAILQHYVQLGTLSQTTKTSLKNSGGELVKFVPVAAQSPILLCSALL